METAKDVVGMKLISDETPESTQVSNKNLVSTGWTSAMWGWLPVLSLTSALGVFLVALAAEAGRLSSEWADPLFWLGLMVLFVPITARIISPKPARQERIALLVMLGSALYFLRFLEQPLAFGYNDEFLQWRTALNIAVSGHLFFASPVLPISPFYPGLQIVTNALSSLTGLSIFSSGMIIINVAGLVLVLALYQFYDYISGSAQVAGIATLLYMAKPTFFADTLYHYEDLAIPLMIFVLFVIIRRSHEHGGRRVGLTLAIWLGLAALVVTHHVASYMLDLFLILWTAAFLILKIKALFQKNRGQEAQASPGWVALLAIVLSVAWLAYTGAQAVGYLYPTFATTVNEFIQILTGVGAARQFFHDAGGFVEPLWERVTAFAAVGLISLGLPFGLIQFWRHYRANAAAIALAVVVLAYPVSLLIRLTSAGVNLGGRLQPYLFGSVAFVLAIGVTHFWLSRAPKWRYQVTLTGAIAIIFMGGWITGTSPLWNRLPGSYLPYSDQRSIQPESVTAAGWAISYLGTGQRVISDQVNTILMATYGGEWVVTTANDQIVVSSVFTSPQFDSDVEATLRLGNVQYVVVDRRLIGVDQTGYSQPVDSASLAKFDGVQGVNRIFDSGNIIIYDVKAISSGAVTTTTPQPSCVLTSSTGASGSYPNMAKFYAGTLGDIPTGLTVNISLTGIQQQQGTICGYFGGIPANAHSQNIPTNGPFKGTITADKHIQFTLTNNSGQATFTFEGVIQPNGRLAGTYCNVGAVIGQCSDYGLWSLSPTTQSG
jgi:hypothetical protein